MQINSNVFKLTPMMNLITLYGAMKLQFSLRITDVFARGKMERSLDQNLARSIPVWAGISKKGATAVCIFEGIMAAPLYCKILERTLLPFIRQKSQPPCTHRYIQDNDPKHTSRPAQNFYSQSGINWWCTPAESPHLNPIENLWHELKEYVRREVKPTTKLELVNGI